MGLPAPGKIILRTWEKASFELVGIEAWGNGDEGVKLSEADDGMQIEEEGDGDLAVTVNGTVTFDNKPGKAGLNFEESDAGDGTLKVRGSNIDSIDTNVDEI